MISKSLLAQTKCRLIEFRREPSAMYWVVFMPIFWMVVLGFAFSNETQENYGVVLIASDSDPNYLAEVAATLDRAASITLIRGDKNTANSALVRGRAVLKVEAGPPLVLHLDPSNREAKIAGREVVRVLEAKQDQSDRVEAIIKPLTLPGQRYVDWLIPGLLGLSIMSTSLFGVGMTIVSNRKENLLKRFCATPLPKHEYLISHIYGRVVSLAIEAGAILIAGWAIFDFLVQGSHILFAVTALLGMFCFTAIAMLCGARTKSLPMISGITNLLMILMVMTSGVFFSKTNYPDWIQPAIDLIPLTALVDALRMIALEGVGLTDVGGQLAILIAYSVVAMAAAIWRFVWY